MLRWNPARKNLGPANDVHLEPYQNELKLYMLSRIKVDVGYKFLTLEQMN